MIYAFRHDKHTCEPNALLDRVLGLGVNESIDEMLTQEIAQSVCVCAFAAPMCGLFPYQVGGLVTCKHGYGDTYVITTRSH
jgi:hypothetical protein